MAKINAWGSDNPAEVDMGGTGVASTTAYAVQCGGTTATAPLQSIASVGTADQVLTSNGAGALPTFQDAGGGGNWVLIDEETASTSASVEFTDLSSDYSNFYVAINNVIPASASDLYLQVSQDNGTNWRTSGYASRLASITTVASGSTPSAGIGLAGNSTSLAAGSPIFVSCFINSPVSSSYYTGASSHGYFKLNGSNAKALTIGGGYYGTAEANTAIRFIMSTGNITSGLFSLYGLSAS